MCSIQKCSVNKMVCQSMVPAKCGIRIKDDCYAKLSHFRSAALGKLVTLPTPQDEGFVSKLQLD